MDEQTKNNIVQYLDKSSTALVGLLLIIFPLAFSSITTDFFTLPKQAILTFTVLVLVLLFGVKVLLQQKLVLRKTVFDLPVILLITSVLLSSIFSLNRVNSFINFVPFLFAALSYFAIVNNAKDHKSVLAILYSFLGGAALSGLISLLSFFKVYVFPFDFAKVQGFTTMGTTLDLAVYLLMALGVGAYLLSPYVSNREKLKSDGVQVLGLGIGSIAILIGLLVSVYQMVFVQNPVLLPISVGFQTAFAAISQDAGRILQGFLFGSGYGTYVYDFTRFKPATFNLNQALWTLTFYRSSSLVLELLATTGLLGLLSFLLLCYRAVKERPLFIPLVLLLAAAFILPFSFVLTSLIFILLGLYAAIMGLKHERKYFDVELQLVQFKKGIFAISAVDGREKGISPILSYVVFGLILLFTLGVGYVSFNYLNSNIIFEKSLVAAAANNGSQTYTLQNQAIGMFNNNDSYYRLFSQTNLALANSLANSVPKGATPSAQTQQTIYTLIQQSINAGRQATTLAPQDATNWQNLSSIYRSLIGFGQNADAFAISTAQQATMLDPNNPQEYINLGGIYYQLGQWDKAQEQFQTAANLKPDFANAYYNLAHTLIQKGDLKGAQTQLLTVKQLVQNDKTNLDKINAEIADLQKQIDQGTAQNEAASSKTLKVNEPSAKLPAQNPQVKIPAPSVSPTPKVSATPTPTTTEGGLTITPSPTP